MKSRVKDLGRAITPPILWRALSRAVRENAAVQVEAKPAEKRYGQFGDFASFEAAKDFCKDGYDNSAVLAKTLELTRGVCSSQIISQLNIRLLAALQYAIARTEAPARVLDYGGALGVHYFSLNRYLPSIEHWRVVEIAETVNLGSKEFANEVLSFSSDLEDRAQIVLASGTLQYTPSPYEALASLLSLRTATYLVLDKVPLYERDRIVVHDIHPSLFGTEVAFPLHLFNNHRFRKLLEPHTIIFEWELPNYAAVLDGETLEIYRGFVVELRR